MRIGRGKLITSTGILNVEALIRRLDELEQRLAKVEKGNK